MRNLPVPRPARRWRARLRTVRVLGAFCSLLSGSPVPALLERAGTGVERGSVSGTELLDDDPEGGGVVPAREAGPVAALEVPRLVVAPQLVVPPALAVVTEQVVLVQLEERL